jgi:hypothetical protein
MNVIVWEYDKSTGELRRKGILKMEWKKKLTSGEPRVEGMDARTG